MNVLPKGTVTVIMATMIASFLILFFGNAVADSVEKKVEEASLQAKEKVFEVKGKEQLETSTVSVIRTNSPPPPGPFALDEPVIVTEVNKLIALSNTRMAPKLEKQQPAKPIKLQEIVFKRMQPSIPIAPLKLDQPIPVSIDKHFIEQLPKLKKPKLVKEKPVSPVTPEKVVSTALEVSKPVLTAEVSVPTQVKKNTVTPSKPINSKTEPSEPIWNMKPPIISPITQLSGGTPQQQYQYGVNQPPVPMWPRNMMRAPINNQQYMYVPMPVYPPSFTYPQIPMNNNGYSFSGNRLKSQPGFVRQGWPMNIPQLGSPDIIEKSK